MLLREPRIIPEDQILTIYFCLFSTQKSLTNVQKCDIATQQLDELKDIMQKIKEEAERNCEKFMVCYGILSN